MIMMKPPVPEARRWPLSKPRGLSLLEILVAMAILLIGLYPLVQTFRTGFAATRMSKEHGQAMLLADSVMEEIRARIAFGLGRYYGLAESGSTVRQRAAAGEWKNVFTPLAEPRRKIVSANRSDISTYFSHLYDTGSGEGPVDATLDRIAARELAAFECEVKVRFEVDGAPIDSDGDGRAETDMCEVDVTVHWRENATGEEKSARLTSLFTREDFDRALEGS
jgi:prepilin-type N-terminal cleavage/methylation domain-containing protein